MSRFDALYAEMLAEAASRGLARQLRAMEPAGPGRVRVDGRVLVNLSANDYLGLATHPALAARAAEFAAAHGTGAGASRLVTGTQAAHRRIEARLAALKGREAAIIFASGWQANAAVLPALFRAGKGGVMVFADRLIHASLHHGIAAAGLRQQRFRHNDLDHLETLLRAAAGKPGTRFIVTESVFSMDGDRADLPALARLAERHGAFLYVDEAHATGVLGPGGAGLCAGLDAAGGGVDLVMGTFSKAFGAAGAYVAGSRVLIEYLVQSCSGFIHTTAPPPPVLGAIDAALDLLPDLEVARAALQERAQDLRAGLRRRGYDCGASSTQIVPVILGGTQATLRLASSLEERGFLAAPIRPPTVPPGGSRLRLALSVAHGENVIAGLLAALPDAPPC